MQALKSLKNGGYFLAMNVPPGIEFGLDYQTWKIGEKFKGVKAIPPGVHYVHTTG